MNQHTDAHKRFDTLSRLYCEEMADIILRYFSEPEDEECIRKLLSFETAEYVYTDRAEKNRASKR